MATDGRKFSEFGQALSVGDTLRFAVYDPQEGLEFNQNKTVAATALDLRYATLLGNNYLQGGLRFKPTIITTTSHTMAGSIRLHVYNGTANSTWTLPSGVQGANFVIINNTDFNLNMNPGFGDSILNSNPFIIYPKSTYEAFYIQEITTWVFK